MLGKQVLLVVALVAGALATPAASAGPVGPQVVSIAGYAGDAAEPFLSRDGRWLFFNSGYGSGVNTDLFAAERVDDLHFVFRGPVGGANTAALDAVGSADRAGELFFISTRSYDRTQSTLYRGWLLPGGTSLSGVSLVSGMKASGPAKVVFDEEVSPDGSTLYFAEGQYLPFSPLGVPVTADVGVAKRTNGGFERDAASTALLSKVNTPALEYAAAISPDGLTLSFTRVVAAPGGSPQIFLATRPSVHAPFGSPTLVSAATGFVEAATFTPDGRAIYFHHKVGDRYRIERLAI